MNRTRTKQLRAKVLQDMQYEPNEQETAREIHRYPEFRKIFRAAKKNHLAGQRRQSPKQLTTEPVSPVYRKWFKVELKRRQQRREWFKDR